MREGGLGGPGGEGFTGGEGGDGDGPILDIDPSGRWKIGNISGELQHSNVKIITHRSQEEQVVMEGRALTSVGKVVPGKLL
jgi:hypothetical protein